MPLSGGFPLLQGRSSESLAQDMTYPDLASTTHLSMLLTCLPPSGMTWSSQKPQHSPAPSLYTLRRLTSPCSPSPARHSLSCKTHLSNHFLLESTLTPANPGLCTSLSSQGALLLPLLWHFLIIIISLNVLSVHYTISLFWASMYFSVNHRN